MNTDILLKKACQDVIDHPYIRYGQAVFNALFELDPETADVIRGGSLDPFYHDSRVPQLIDWLNR